MSSAKKKSQLAMGYMIHVKFIISIVYPSSCRVLEIFTTAGCLATAEIKCLPSNQGEATQETGIHYQKIYLFRD